MDGDRSAAVKGDAVTLVLDTDLDISRGAVLSEVPRRPINADVIETRLVWLSETPFDPEAGYLLRTATDLAGHEHERFGAGRLRDASIATRPWLRRPRTSPIAASCSAAPRRSISSAICRSPGTLSLSAPLTATVAGGVITWAQAGAPTVGDNVFVIDRALLERGLCADLGDSPQDQAEFSRRAQELAVLMRSAGVPVLVEI